MTARTVAIFDILGVKEDIKAGRTEALFTEYVELVDLAKDQLLNFGKYDPARDIFLRPIADKTYRCSLQIFSDTIILISEDDSFDGFLEVALASWRITQTFLMYGRPLRGAISFGDMQVDRGRSVFVGTALVDAHELEARQAWVGASLHPSIMERFPVSYWNERGLGLIVDGWFPEYLVPIKEGAPSLMRALNWRLQYVVKDGLLKKFQQRNGVQTLEELHPYTQAMFAFASAMRPQAYLGGDFPVQLSVFWVGDTQPPFPHGDAY